MSTLNTPYGSCLLVAEQSPRWLSAAQFPTLGFSGWGEGNLSIHGVSSLGFSTHGLCVYQAVTLPSSLHHPHLVCPECLHWLPVLCCFPLRLELCPRLQRTLVWLDGLVSEAGHLPVSPATHCWMCLEEKSWGRVPWFITGFPQLYTSPNTEQLMVIWPMDVRVY